MGLYASARVLFGVTSSDFRPMQTGPALYAAFGCALRSRFDPGDTDLSI